jgi:hypothetical protein
MLAALGISKGSGPVGAAAHAERLLAIVLP